MKTFLIHQYIFNLPTMCIEGVQNIFIIHSIIIYFVVFAYYIVKLI